MRYSGWYPIYVLALLGLLAMSGACRQQSQQASATSESRITPITVTRARAAALDVLERSVGQLQAKAVPDIAARVAGEIVAIHVDAGQAVGKGQLLAEIDPRDYRLARDEADPEVRRLRALIHAQSKKVSRFLTMEKDRFVNQSLLDEAQAELEALRARLTQARARLAIAERNLEKTRITSPITGRVDQRLVSVGDYVTVGTPVYRIAALNPLQVHLPFPETLASILRPGLRVRLSTPTSPGHLLEGRITHIRPVISTSNRALDVIAEVENPGGWEPGASVNGAVVIHRYAETLLVPEISVVRRPAGRVVYRVEEGRVKAQVVRTGVWRDGSVQILEGLRAGEVIAADGAGFLTDGAQVRIVPSADPT